ncbi:conserved hypothetical protein [Aeromicrobium sp. 9AM]|nr:conserved hypothetical protein [Aeromicrobium sp. 9AM]
MRAEAKAAKLELTPAWVGALTSLADRVQRESDPAVAIRSVNRTLRMMPCVLQRLAAIRILAVGRLRVNGLSYGDIATATGLSKSRVAQLSAAATRASHANG